MTLKQYLILMAVGSAICWLAWFFVITNIDPATAGFTGFLFFYVSLFLALVGTFSVVGFCIRKIIIKHDNIIFHHVRSTFRQSIIISICCVSALLLQQFKLLTWWNVILLGVILLVIEGIVFTGRKYKNKDIIS